MRNDVSGRHHSIQVMLTGVKSNRSAIGALVTVSYGGKKQAQEVLSQSSYLSCNLRRLHFGLGRAPVADIEIRWPAGQTEKLTGVVADQVVHVTEGRGITKCERFREKQSRG